MDLNTEEEALLAELDALDVRETSIEHEIELAYSQGTPLDSIFERLHTEAFNDYQRQGA